MRAPASPERVTESYLQDHPCIYATSSRRGYGISVDLLIVKPRHI